MQPSQPIRRAPGQPTAPATAAAATASHAAEPEPAQGGQFLGTPARRFQPVVSYRTKMKNGQCFPLAVVLQEEGKPLAKKKQEFLPDGSKPVVTVYPVIAGAQVTPVSIDISPVHGNEARFMVAPVTRGTLKNARVELRAGGKVLSSTPLSMTVSARRLTKFLALMTILIPCLLFYIRTHQMVQWKTELPKPPPRDPNVPIPTVQPGGRPGMGAGMPGMGPGMPGAGGGAPGGRPPGPGGPGGPGGPPGGRPQGSAPSRNGNGQPGSQQLPRPPAGDAPKKDQESKAGNEEGAGLQEISLQQPAEKKTAQGDAKDKDQKKADTAQPADAKQPDKKPEGDGRGPDRPAEPAAKPADADHPKTAESGSKQYELKLEGGSALSFWFQRSTSRVHYNRSEVNIGDSADILVYALVWLNNDAFTWVQKDKLPFWANDYCLDFVLGDNWKPNDAVSSLYDRILRAPFIEIFALCGLFVLTLLVRLAQDPKRRTRKGAVFTI